MKLYKLLILLLPLQTLIAQPGKGIYAGPALGGNMLLENYNGGRHSEFLPPPEIYLHIGNVFDKHLRLEAFAGYIPFADNWDGFDLGLSLKSQVINKLYITAGFNYNTTSTGESEGNFAPTYNQRDYSYISLGAGYYVTKIMYIEFEYEIPLNNDRVYGTAYGLQTTGISASSLKLRNRLKLVFGWDFNVL
jgi:hypothetical protein